MQYVGVTLICSTRALSPLLSLALALAVSQDLVRSQMQTEKSKVRDLEDLLQALRAKEHAAVNAEQASMHVCVCVPNAATHCNALRHTATQCITLKHTSKEHAAMNAEQASLPVCVSVYVVPIQCEYIFYMQRELEILYSDLWLYVLSRQVWWACSMKKSTHV